jgi:hypothetical protein
LAFAGARANHKIIGEAGLFMHIQQNDVFGFLVFQSVNQ